MGAETLSREIQSDSKELKGKIKLVPQLEEDRDETKRKLDKIQRRINEAEASLEKIEQEVSRENNKMKQEQARRKEIVEKIEEKIEKIDWNTDTINKNTAKIGSIDEKIKKLEDPANFQVISQSDRQTWAVEKAGNDKEIARLKAQKASLQAENKRLAQINVGLEAEKKALENVKNTIDRVTIPAIEKKIEDLRIRGKAEFVRKNQWIKDKKKVETELASIDREIRGQNSYASKIAAYLAQKISGAASEIKKTPRPTRRDLEYSKSVWP